MKQRKIKKSVKYSLLAIAFISLFSTIYYIEFKDASLKEKEDTDYNYVSRLYGDNSVPVVNTSTRIIRPYNDENVKVVQNYYKQDSTEEEQEKAITNYEQTYIQSTGTSYGNVESGFDVLSVLEGTVKSVKQTDLLGYTIEIENTDKVTTYYQSLSDVKVKEGDKVNQGDIIGMSGESNINKDLKNHLTFKIKINGIYVDPEEYYNKDINEI